MASYDLTSGKTGRTYKVEFDNDPTPEDVDFAIDYFDNQPVAEEQPGYLSQLGTALSTGTQTALASGRTAFNVLTGDTEDTATALADLAAAQREAQAAQTPEDVAFLTNLQQQARELEAAEGILPTLREAVDLPLAALRQPGAALKTAVQSLPNVLVSTPVTIGAGLAGAAAGGLVGLPTTGPGALVTGALGAAAGGALANTALEVGPAVFDILNERTDGAAANWTREQIVEALKADPSIVEEGLKRGATRGAVIGATEAIGLGAGSRIAGASGRAVQQATRRALVEQGVDLADNVAVRAGMQLPAVQAAREAAQAGFTRAGEVARVAAGAGVETASSGAGELLAQVASGQEVSTADAFLEMLGEGVAAVPSVLAGAAADANAARLQRAAENTSIAAEALGDLFPDLDELEAQVGREAADAVAQAVVDAGAPAVPPPGAAGRQPSQIPPPPLPIFTDATSADDIQREIDQRIALAQTTDFGLSGDAQLQADLDFLQNVLAARTNAPTQADPASATAALPQPPAVQPSGGTNAGALMSAAQGGLERAFRNRMRDRIAKGETVIFTRPDSIEAARNNPFYITQDLPDGTVQVTGVRPEPDEDISTTEPLPAGEAQAPTPETSAAQTQATQDEIQIAEAGGLPPVEIQPLVQASAVEAPEGAALGGREGQEGQVDLPQDLVEWDRDNRNTRGDEWFTGGHMVNREFEAAAAEGADQLQAHGMAKEATLSGGLRNLLNLLRNGVDPKRGGGQLYTAQLAKQKGQVGVQGATASGTAYRDGPFVLVQNREASQAGLGIRNVNEIAAVLVNEANVGQLDAIRSAIQSVNPNIIVAPYSEVSAVTRQILNQPVQPMEVAPAVSEPTAPQAEVVSPEGVTPTQPLPPTGGVPTESLPAGQPTSGDVGTALRAVATNTAAPEQVANLETQGLARTVQGQPVITDARLAQMPEAERPRLTEAERVAEIEGQGGVMASTGLRVQDMFAVPPTPGQTPGLLERGVTYIEPPGSREAVRIYQGLRPQVSFAEMQSIDRLTRKGMSPALAAQVENDETSLHSAIREEISDLISSGAMESGPQASEYYEREFSARYRAVLQGYADLRLPLLAEDVDSDRRGTTLPEGYVREGDLYVFRPEGGGAAPTNTPPANVQPSIRPLQGDQQRNETLARRKRPRPSSPTVLRARDGSPLSNIRVTADNAARARAKESRQVPGASETWIGTTEDFLAEFAGTKAASEVEGNPAIEAFYDPATDRAVVLTDRVQVLEGDARRAVRNGTSAAEEAVRRLIRHESFVHRGWRALPSDLRTQFLALSDSVVTAEDLDTLAKTYRRYANWRDDPSVKALAFEEWLAQRIERIEKLPAAADGPLAQVKEWLSRVWQWLTGDDSLEATPTELANVIRTMVRALETGEKEVAAEPIRPSIFGSIGDLPPYFGENQGAPFDLPRDAIVPEPREPSPQLIGFWERLATTPEVFKYPTTDSADPAVVAEVFSTPESQLQAEQVTNNVIVLAGPNEGQATINLDPVTKRAVININTRGGPSGQLYQAALTLVHNLGFKKEQLNLSPRNAASRVVSNLLSSALRHGTTAHIDNSALPNLPWREGDDGFNVASMADYEARFVEANLPKLFTRPPDARGILRSENLRGLVSPDPVTLGQVDSWVRELANDPVRAASYGIGPATLVRHAVTRLASSGEITPEQGRLAGEDGGVKLLYSLTQDTNADTLRRIVSEASEGPEATSQAQPFAPGVTPDMPLQQLADGRMAEANLKYEVAQSDLQVAKAIEFVNAMGPVGEMGQKLLSPEWRAEMGLDMTQPFTKYVIAEALLRAQGRMNDVTTEGIAAKRTAAILGGLRSGTATNAGQSLNAELQIQRNPRYAAMFVVQGAMEMTNKTSATVVDPQTNVPAATDAVRQGDEQARQQATGDLAEELRLRDLIYDMGIAAQDAGIAERIRRINDNVFRLGVIERMRAAMAASGVAPSMVTASRAAVEQQYEGFTLEQLEAEAARLRDEIRQDVAAVEQAAKATPRKGRKGADPASQAKTLIDKLEASPQVPKKPKPNPVRDLYQKHLKEPMAAEDFVGALTAMGVDIADAQKLYDLAAIKIAAAQATNTQAKLSRYLSNEGSALAAAVNNVRSKTEGAPTWQQLFNQPFETQRQWRQRFYEALRADPALANLTPQETRDLAAALDKVWNDKRERNLQSILKRANLPGTKEKTKQKIAESVPLLLRYLNTGVFNDDSFRAAVAKKFGAKVLTADDLAKISDLAQRAQKDGITTPERTKLLDEMIRTIQLGAGVELGEVISNVWVTSVLSGFRTQFEMALSSLNGLRGMAQTAADVAIRKRNFKMVGEAAKAYFKTMANTILESANYFVTGDPTLLDGYQYTATQFMNEGLLAANPFDFFEQVIKDPRVGPWGKITAYFFAGIQRAMRIWDHVNSTSVKEGMIPLAMALDPERYKDARMPSKEDVAMAKEKAISIAGGNKTWSQKKEVTAWTRQILNDLLNSRYPGIIDEARETGFTLAYQNDPTGLGGIVYHTLLGVTKKMVNAAGKFRDEGVAKREQSEWNEAAKVTDKAMRGLLYIGATNSRNMFGFRFVRFVGNRVNELISFTPLVGLARLAEKDMSATKRSMIYTNQVVGSMFGLWVISSMLRAMEDEEDPEKRGFDVEGSWSNLTPTQKNQRRGEGKIPYSIKIGDTNFNYNAWPMASLIATVGNLYDMKRYRPDKWNEKDVFDRLISAAWSGATSFTDISSLSGLMDLLGRSAYSTDPVEGAKQWAAKFSANYVGGFIPRALKDLDMVFDPEARKPDNLFGYFAKEIPFYRRTEAAGEKLYDIFGEPVQMRREPWSRSFSQDKLEPEYNLLGDLNERGIFLSPANPDNRTVGSGANRRELTKAEAEAYMMETGKLYKDYVLQQGERLKELDFETAKEKVSRDTERLRNAALRRAIAITTQ